MHTELTNGVILIPLPPYFNVQCLKEFVTTSHEALDKKPTLITIDFNDTEMIDSSGIGALVSLLKRSKSAGVRLSLCGLNESIRQLFEETELDKMFNIETVGGTRVATINLFEQSAEIKLDVRNEISGDVHIMHMSGIMNHPFGSRFFKQEFLMALANHRKILLDLEDLTFFDSLSVSDILTMNRLLKETGGSLRMCGANYIVNDLFSTLNIDQVVPFFNKSDDALSDWNV